MTDEERKAVELFLSLCRVLDALPPGSRILDEQPLRGVIPGAWPTMGDLRRLAALLTKVADDNGIREVHS